MQMFLNGSFISADMTDNLSRAVVISLFTWRRADNNDDYDLELGKKGWWGDTYPQVPSDKIGSKLWMLLRQKITDETIARAEEYSEQALQWLIDDGHCSSLSVTAERDPDDPNRLNLQVIITQNSQSLNYEFKELI